MKRNYSFQLAPLKIQHNLIVARKNLNKSEMQKTTAQFRIRQIPVLKKNFGVILQNVNKALKNSHNHSQFISLQQIKAQHAEERSSSSSEDLDEETQKISVEITNEFLGKHLELLIKETILESFSEITSAALILHANSLCDNLINEKINELAQNFAICMINELKNSELFSISDMIEDQICVEGLLIASSEYITELYSKMIFKELIFSFDLNITAFESIAEELIYNTQRFFSIYNYLIECILSEEWLEILVEDEISLAKISENFKLLPPNSQKEINKRIFYSKTDAILEEIYFDILNTYVSNIWARNIIEYTISGEEPDDNILMPILIVYRDKKKNTFIHLPSYQLSINR